LGKMSIFKSVHEVFEDKDEVKHAKISIEQSYVNQETTVASFLEELDAPSFEDVRTPGCIFVNGEASASLVTPESLDVNVFVGQKVGSVVGCFCPPHRGHYSMVAALGKQLDIVLLKTVNYSTDSRHGTPLEHTMATWIKWCATIPNTKFFIFWSVWNSWVEESVPADVDGVYMHVSIEDESQRQKLMDEAKQYNFSQYKNVSKSKHRLIVQTRTGSVSATEFVRALKDDAVSVDECVSRFVPEEIGTSAGRAYVQHIRDTYGKQLSVKRVLASHLLLLLI